MNEPTIVDHEGRTSCCGSYSTFVDADELDSVQVEVCKSCFNEVDEHFVESIPTVDRGRAMTKPKFALVPATELRAGDQVNDVSLPKGIVASLEPTTIPSKRGILGTDPSTWTPIELDGVEITYDDGRTAPVVASVNVEVVR